MANLISGAMIILLPNREWNQKHDFLVVSTFQKRFFMVGMRYFASAPNG